MILTLSLTIFIVTKSKNEAVARKTIKNLLLSFLIVSVDGRDCVTAIDLPMSDFEDALVVVCAEKAALNYIITNDRDLLRDMNSSVPMISPSSFLLMFQG